MNLAKLFLALSVSSACAAENQPSQAEQQTGPFRFEAISASSLGIFEGEKPVLVYNHGIITNAAAPRARPHTAYFHPVYGLDGEILTGDFPADHLYHRGLYWAWPHIKIGEQEYDLWSLRGIGQEFEGWREQKISNDRAILAFENSWMAGDKKVLTEQVRVAVHRADKNGRAIDLELSLTPVDKPITLWGAPGKSYGGLNFRFGPRSETIITVPEGRAPGDLLVTRMPWVDFSGDLAKGQLSGVAVFVHPDHPDFPPEWMTRHYGLLAAGWPGVKAQTLEAGKTVKLRYRIWIHRGAPRAEAIQEMYDAFRSAK